MLRAAESRHDSDPATLKDNNDFQKAKENVLYKGAELLGRGNSAGSRVVFPREQ